MSLVRVSKEKQMPVELSPRCYQMIEEFLKAHENATLIVFDTVNNIPIKAIYICPIWQVLQDRAKAFDQMISVLSREKDEPNQS